MKLASLIKETAGFLMMLTGFVSFNDQQTPLWVAIIVLVIGLILIGLFGLAIYSLL